MPAVGGLVRIQRRQRAGGSGLATSAFVATHFAAAAAALGWVVAEWMKHGKPSVLGGISGCGRRAGGDHAGFGLREADARRC